MTDQESPQIELFMYSLNQEFPVGKGHATFLRKRSELRVDEKTGELFTLQEVESQVFSRYQIPKENLPSGGVTKQQHAAGGGSSPEDSRALLGNEHLAAKKVPLAAFDPDAGDKVASVASIAWTAQWAQNGWVAQWAQNSTYTNT